MRGARPRQIPFPKRAAVMRLVLFRADFLIPLARKTVRNCEKHAGIAALRRKDIFSHLNCTFRYVVRTVSMPNRRHSLRRIKLTWGVRRPRFHASAKTMHIGASVQNPHLIRMRLWVAKRAECNGRAQESLGTLGESGRRAGSGCLKWQESIYIYIISIRIVFVE